MIDIGKLKTLPEDVDIGKIRLSDGRWLVVSTMSRIADDTGAGIGLNVVDRKGNELQLAVLTDTTDGIEHGIRLLHASDPYEDDDMQQDWFWEDGYFEDEEQKS